MPQAVEPNNAAEPDFTLTELSACVAKSAPSIFTLGSHLADVERAYEAFDTSRPVPGVKSLDCAAAGNILDRRRDALRDLICTLPAQTLQDAAVQIEVASTIASDLAASRFDEATSDAMIEKIERILLGILPIVTKAAGLDLSTMFWAGADHLRVARFAGVGVAS